MLKCWLVFQNGGKLPGDGLEFSSFGWFPQFNKVSCLNFVCISSSKMYANRYWVTKIARMRVFSFFFIKITSGHRTLSRKASFWTIRTLSKDYGRIWYGDRKYFSRRPSITQLRELKIPRRFERSRRRLKMYLRLFIVYRDYSNLHSFPHHNWFYLLSPLHSNHKAIKQKNQMFYHFLWKGKGDKIKDNSCDQWIWVWRPKDDWSLLFQHIS